MTVTERAVNVVFEQTFAINGVIVADKVALAAAIAQQIDEAVQQAAQEERMACVAIAEKVLHEEGPGHSHCVCFIRDDILARGSKR